MRIVTPLTKYAVTVVDPLRIRYHVERALHLAKAERGGPVWLDIPLDVQGAELKVLRGFGDIFRISKHKPNGPDRYNMAYRRPEPLVATAETAALGRQLQEQLRAARQGYQAAIASMRTVFTDFTTSEHARISPPA